MVPVIVTVLPPAPAPEEGDTPVALDAPAMMMVRLTSLALSVPMAAALAMTLHSPTLLQYVILPVAESTMQSLVSEYTTAR